MLSIPFMHYVVLFPYMIGNAYSSPSFIIDNSIYVTTASMFGIVMLQQSLALDRTPYLKAQLKHTLDYLSSFSRTA